MRLRVLLIAEEAAGIQTLRLIVGLGHKIVAVVAAPPRPPRHHLPNVWQVSNALGLHTWDAHTVKGTELVNRVQKDAIDLILNVHSLHILPGAALREARIGAFNLHPAALPRYAGLNAVSWAMYRGETVHGVTVHWMVPEVDAGPIAYQTQFPILPTDSAFAVAGRCTREGLLLLRRLVEAAAILPSAIPNIPQDLSQREYFGRGVPEQGLISWAWPARRVVNFVRACDFFPSPSPWEHPRALFVDEEFMLGKASLTGRRSEDRPGNLRSRDGELEVAASDEWVRIDNFVVNERLVKPAEMRRLIPA